LPHVLMNTTMPLIVSIEFDFLSTSWVLLVGADFDSLGKAGQILQCYMKYEIMPCINIIVFALSVNLLGMHISLAQHTHHLKSNNTFFRHWHLAHSDQDVTTLVMFVTNN